MATSDSQPDSNGAASDFDVVVAGAGMAGLYQLHRLRELGFSVRVFETGDDVGGTWYWNRYPGARCDIQTVDYSYTWDPELEVEWEWSERYATQPEILRYLQHVADKHDLRRDIQFSTRIDSAVWDDSTDRWTLQTSDGRTVTCRYYVMATGCLSLPKAPDIEGAERVRRRRLLHEQLAPRGRRLHRQARRGDRHRVVGDPVDPAHRRPGVAAHRVPAHAELLDPGAQRPAPRGAPPALRGRSRGVPRGGPPVGRRRADGRAEPGQRTRRDATRSARRQTRRMWQGSELLLVGAEFSDVLTNAEANETVSEFVRDKIRSIVDDPETAETLCPKYHYISTKRPCLDTNYYETYNLPHVRLVDLRKTPITTVTETGIDTTRRAWSSTPSSTPPGSTR